MEEIKFRNHYSVVLEKMSGFVFIIVILIIQNLDNTAEILKDYQEWKMSGIGMEQTLGAFMIFAGIILLAGIVILINSLIWSKTWFTITESTVIMERNTLNRTRNTIGMKNISNVNTEQNILEKILGTCKVKLDTNSLSTANSTDVKIVLKKKKALEIQELILKRVNVAQGQEMNSEENGVTFNRNDNYDVFASDKDVFIHGICCMNISTMLILFGCVTGIITAFTTLGDNMTGSVITILANLVIVIGIIIACLRSLFGGFITYHDFKVGRRGDKLYIHYGLFRTIDYTIPVSKINGVVIHQTMIGRILKRYMVELVNVGMGDEKEESGSYIILACNRAQLQQQLELLLPEYAEVPIDKIERQPKAIIWNKFIKNAVFAAVLVITGVICVNVIPVVEVWMVAAGCIPVIGFGILLSFMDYCTAGMYFNEKEILVANGCFRRDITVMPYENIQYLKFETNFVMSHWGLTKGTAYLLASMKNQSQNLPACEIEKLEPYIQNSYIRTY